ncbi:MAG: hypothetical protein ACT4PZ_21790 [Panacagrimonas sp.]
MLGACSTTPVVPPTQFPKPVLRQVPVRMGLYMDNAFSNYVFVDKPVNGLEQRVSVGPASKGLFTEFLTAQFTRLTVLNKGPGAQAEDVGVQAILQPVVEQVQIASPINEKDEFHEAWIKYRLKLLTPQGREITAWELAAYGKHRGAAIGGTNASLTAAVNDAMRDAAAGMALIFRDGPGFQTRLAAALAMTSGAASP